MEIRRERAIYVAALCLTLVWVAWEFTGSANESVALCADAYARARTAADTIAVDDRRAGGRGLSTTCGRLRREGFLDGHRSPIEQRRETRSAAAAPLIEK